MHSYQRNLADSIQSLKRESSIYRFSHKSNTLCHRDRKKYYELVHKIVSLKRKHKLVTSILDSHVPVLRKDRNQGKYMESCPSDQNQSASRANKIVSTTAVDDGHFNYKIFLGTEIKSLTLRNKINEIKVRLETTLPDLVAEVQLPSDAVVQDLITACSIALDIDSSVIYEVSSSFSGDIHVKFCICL